MNQAPEAIAAKLVAGGWVYWIWDAPEVGPTVTPDHDPWSALGQKKERVVSQPEDIVANLRARCVPCSNLSDMLPTIAAVVALLPLGSKWVLTVDHRYEIRVDRSGVVAQFAIRPFDPGCDRP